MSEHSGPGQASHADICDGALRHYESISNEACSWCSTVPKAIAFYKQHGPVFSTGEYEKAVDALLEALDILFQPRYEIGSVRFNNALRLVKDRLRYLIAAKEGR